MKSSVTTKLFIAIFATSMLMAIAMGVAARVSFVHGFLGYLNEQGVERMDTLMPDLVEAYHDNGSWEFLRDNPRVWFRLIRPQAKLGPDTDGDGKPDPVVAPGDSPDVEMTGLNLRVAVLDRNRELVIGYQQLGPNAVMRPIVVDGSTVGWLAMVPFEEVSVDADVRFQQQQLRANLVIGLLGILLAAFVALGLARMFVAPVRRVAAATRRLAAGDYLARVQETSRDEIGRLAADFNQLAFTLEKNERMRRVFVADVSHELRTPLAVLKGELEALEDGVRPLTPESIHSLQAEIALLNKLVSDLYDLSLSDAGALTYRKSELDITDVLHACVEAVRERFAVRHLRLLEAPRPPELIVLADEGRLRQLFGNLLENSLRYTDSSAEAPGELRVSARVEAGQVRIDFEDSAPGVAPELLPRLFERFYRVEGSRNRASGGAGLGLAICRNIVEAHGGRLTAEASRLGGVRMTITLPLIRSR